MTPCGNFNCDVTTSAPATALPDGWVREVWTGRPYCPQHSHGVVTRVYRPESLPQLQAGQFRAKCQGHPVRDETGQWDGNPYAPVLFGDDDRKAFEEHMKAAHRAKKIAPSKVGKGPVSSGKRAMPKYEPGRPGSVITWTQDGRERTGEVWTADRSGTLHVRPEAPEQGELFAIVRRIRGGFYYEGTLTTRQHRMNLARAGQLREGVEIPPPAHPHDFEDVWLEEHTKWTREAERMKRMYYDAPRRIAEWVSEHPEPTLESVGG